MGAFFVVDAEDCYKGRSVAERVRILLESADGRPYELVARGNYTVGVRVDDEKKESTRNYLTFGDNEIWVGAGRLDDEKPGHTFIDLVQIARRTSRSFYSHMRGHFCVAHIDLKARVLEVATNRFGSVPIFWAQGDGVLIWAPTVWACLVAPGVTREFDSVALGEGFLFDNILLNRTPFANVRHLPAATVAVCEHTKQPCLNKYWFPKLWGPNSRSVRDLVAEGSAVVKEAVHQAIGDAPSAVVFLSGGLDSRVIVGAARDTCDIETWTQGAPGCWDLVAGRKLSTLLQCKHQDLKLSAHHYIQMNGAMVLLGGGMSHAGHIHMGATAQRFSTPRRVVVTGLLGGPIFGCFSNPHKKDQAMADVEIERYMRVGACLDREELNLLCGADMWSEIRKDLEILMAECLEHNTPSDLAEYIGIMQRQSKLLIFTDRLVGRYHDVRLPYTHYGLAEFCLSLPPEWRYDRRFEQLLIKEAFPDLAGIEVPELGAPPYSSQLRQQYGQLKLRAWRLFQVGLEVASGGRCSPTNPLQKERQGALLREDLRGWLHEHLDLLVERGLLTPEASAYFKQSFLRGRYDLPRFRLIALEHLCCLTENNSATLQPVATGALQVA